jgi:hypothetical protein
MSRGKKQEIICACGCGRKKMVRTADVKRGWGKYFSKSCKAIAQTKRIGRPDLKAAESRSLQDRLINLCERHEHNHLDDTDDSYLHPMEDANFSGEW